MQRLKDTISDLKPHLKSIKESSQLKKFFLIKFKILPLSYRALEEFKDDLLAKIFDIEIYTSKGYKESISKSAKVVREVGRIGQVINPVFKKEFNIIVNRFLRNIKIENQNAK